MFGLYDLDVFDVFYILYDLDDLDILDVLDVLDFLDVLDVLDRAAKHARPSVIDSEGTSTVIKGPNIRCSDPPTSLQDRSKSSDPPTSHKIDQNQATSLHPYKID